MRGRILIIDDEEAIRKSLRMVLEYEGYELIEAGSGPEGLEALRKEAPDAVLLDIKMPQMDGLEVLNAARGRDAHTPIVMISGHGDIPTAVEAIHKGAYDFLEKPLESDRVLTALRNAIERKRLREENLRLRFQVESRLRMIGDAPTMRTVREAIARAAPTNATVLISGESGTGKELIAWEIHRASARAEKPFVKVNCAPRHPVARRSPRISQVDGIALIGRRMQLVSPMRPARPRCSGHRYRTRRVASRAATRSGGRRGG